MKNFGAFRFIYQNLHCFDSTLSSCSASRICVSGHVGVRRYSKSGALKNVDRFGDVDSAIFRPHRVVILSRITRYEFEKILYKDLTEEQFKSKVKQQQSDLFWICSIILSVCLVELMTRELRVFY